MSANKTSSKFYTKTPLFLVATGASVLALVGGVAAAGWYYVRSKVSKRKAEMNAHSVQVSMSAPAKVEEENDNDMIDIALGEEVIAPPSHTSTGSQTKSNYGCDCILNITE